MKVRVKEKVKLSFNITANADRISFLLMFNALWAKHKTYGCHTRIISQKMEGKQHANRILNNS